MALLQRRLRRRNKENRCNVNYGEMDAYDSAAEIHPMIKTNKKYAARWLTRCAALHAIQDCVHPLGSVNADT